MWVLFFIVVTVTLVWGLAKAAGKGSARQPTSPTRPPAHSREYQAPPASPPAASARKARWISAGEVVEVGGESISGGMIYLGGQLPTSRGYGPDNCLVNPALKVGPAPADPSGSTMGYWPSYSSIQPVARRTYLRWLADGRQDPSVGIGYVFLFFYGLERRLFVDRVLDDASAIRAEVERLRSIYEHPSFQGYARNFLDAVDLVSGTLGRDLAPSLDLRHGYQIPLAVRVHLGRKVRDQQPLTADDALLWVLGLPDVYPRTAVSRCFDEFKALWQAKFNAAYPEGLRLRAPKRRLAYDYRPASATFSATLNVEDMPDIEAIAAPLVDLRTQFNGCADLLDPYSRLLGRAPEARGTTEAAALLPDELADTAFCGVLGSIRATLDGHFATGAFCTIKVAELCRILDIAPAPDDKMAAATQRRIANLLDRFDTGFEPDRRYGPVGLSTDSTVVLFKAKAGGPVDPERSDYATARIMTEIATLAALADGEVVASEFEAISSDLESIPTITAVERQRLMAQSLAAVEMPPKYQAALTRLMKLPADQRLRIAQAALSTVLADGRVEPAEVRYLERLHKALGLSQDSVYAALHRGALAPDEPVAILPASWAAGTPIPPEPRPPTPAAVDPARLERVRRETAEVSQLLAGIFVDEEEAAPQAKRSSPAPTEAIRYLGLDGLHAQLLDSVFDAGSLSRDAFDDRARSLKVLPDGALDTINEWAFDTFNEPVLEGDDMIVMPAHLIPQLTAMRSQP